MVRLKLIGGSIRVSIVDPKESMLLSFTKDKPVESAFKLASGYPILFLFFTSCPHDSNIIKHKKVI